MNDSLGVGGIERVVDFDGEIENLVDFERLAGDFFLQRLAFEELHHDESLTLVAADFVDGANVGVVKRRSGAGFALESFEGLRVFGEAFWKELQRDETPQGSVLGLVDDTHPPATQLFEDVVMRDRAADHNGRFLGAGQTGKSTSIGSMSGSSHTSSF